MLQIVLVLRELLQDTTSNDKHYIPRLFQPFRHLSSNEIENWLRRQSLTKKLDHWCCAEWMNMSLM